MPSMPAPRIIAPRPSSIGTYPGSFNLLYWPHGTPSHKPRRSTGLFGLAAAARNDILGQNDGLSQLSHGPPQPPAFVAQPKVSRFFRQFVFGLQDSLGPF